MLPRFLEAEFNVDLTFSASTTRNALCPGLRRRHELLCRRFQRPVCRQLQDLLRQRLEPVGNSGGGSGSAAVVWGEPATKHNGPCAGAAAAGPGGGKRLHCDAGLGHSSVAAVCPGGGQGGPGVWGGGAAALLGWWRKGRAYQCDMHALSARPAGRQAGRPAGKLLLLLLYHHCCRAAIFLPTQWHALLRLPLIGELQTSPGQYNEAVFKGLDYLLDEARKRGIRVSSRPRTARRHAKCCSSKSHCSTRGLLQQQAAELHVGRSQGLP